MNDGIHFTDIAQKFISQSFAFAGATNQAGNIHDLNLCGNNAVGYNQFSQFIQSWIGHIHQSYIRFNGAKAVIACLCFCTIATALNKVDFPTLGNPTIPACKAIQFIDFRF